METFLLASTRHQPTVKTQTPACKESPQAKKKKKKSRRPPPPPQTALLTPERAKTNHPSQSSEPSSFQSPRFSYC
eukprot:1328292-Amorphochlora_amoeboformis.AAC.1